MLRYPPSELWPDLIYRLPDLNYPDRLNACHELLDIHIERGLDLSPAVYFNDQLLTYGDLYKSVTRVAGYLRQVGIKPGDRIMLRLLNRPHFITTWLALLRIGAVAVATAPLLKARELAAIVDSCSPAMIVADPELWEELERLNHSEVTPVNVVAMHSKANSASPYVECAPTSRDDLAIIAYTSGSTGQPKGCMHSHGDLLAPTDTYSRHILNPNPSDRFGGHPTLAFVYGLGGMLLFPLRIGASTVLLDKFTPEALVETIHKHKVTIAFCAPTSLRLMMRQPGALRDSLSSLRCVISAGEALPASVYRAWTDATGIEVLDGIGSTEMLHMFISSQPGRTRPGVTGEVIPGYEALVVDEHTLQPVADGQPGLLAVRGPTGCRYFDLDDRQKQYVRNGWNFPGDIFIRDSDGFFQYQCRNDDLIISGGNNIAGPEIEGVLLEHPAVAEVAVVASPDEIRGMVPKAFVVLRNAHAASDELKKELQDKVLHELAAYKYPRKVEFVAELPKTSTGKIQRTELRRREFQVS